ncbi:hypothetical protein ACTQZM_08300 [Enterococcus cecorum]|uniref:hypothetical protein n=1 Tax=Enterococcus cecorum TaxID=44008 RepID=UPI003F90D9D7
MLTMNNKHIPMWGFDFCIVDNDIWFFHGLLNALLKYDMKKEKLQYICSFPEEINYSRGLYIGITYFEGNLFLIAGKAKNHVVYNIGEKNYVLISNDTTIVSDDIFVYENYLYMKPVKAKDPILRLNMQTKKIDKKIDLNAFSVKKYTDEFLNDWCFITKNKVGLLVLGRNELIIFNLETAEIYIHDLGYRDQHRFTTLQKLGNKLVLCEYGKEKLICIDIENNNEVEICDIATGNVRLVGGNDIDTIFIDRARTKNLFLYNYERQTLKEVSFPDVEVHFLNDIYEYGYGILKKFDNNYYYFNRYLNSFIIMDECFSIVKHYENFYLDENEEKIIKEKLLNQVYPIMQELHMMNVNNLIKSSSTKDFNYVHYYNIVGRDIYKYIIE